MNLNELKLLYFFATLARRSDLDVANPASVVLQLGATEFAEIRRLTIELEKRGSAFPMNPPMEQSPAK